MVRSNQRLLGNEWRTHYALSKVEGVKRPADQRRGGYAADIGRRRSIPMMQVIVVLSPCLVSVFSQRSRSISWHSNVIIVSIIRTCCEWVKLTSNIIIIMCVQLQEDYRHIYLSSNIPLLASPWLFNTCAWPYRSSSSSSSKRRIAGENMNTRKNTKMPS